MKIVNDTKLDFDDVLLVPHRSVATSRSSVLLNKSFRFYNSDQSWSGIPIAIANMDTTGTFDMADALCPQFNNIVCLHKHYKPEEYVERMSDLKNYWYTIGIKENDLLKLAQLVETIGDIPNICIDVANGYTENFVNFCKTVRKRFGSKPIIMAGNICTPDMVQELIIHGGVDIVKVGIGPGCFIAGTKVLTNNGQKKIEQIKVGDTVLTHKGRYRKVIGTKSRIEKETIIDINGIKCTKNHEFYVIHKLNKDLVHESNIEKYAKWVKAEELSDDYLLVKIQE
jgi:GMP reductase